MPPPPGPVDDLPVKATVGYAYRSVFQDPAAFARIAFLPLVISVGAALPLTLLRDSLLAFAFQLIAAAVPYTLFGVAWYRFVLLGPDRAPPALIPQWGPRHWRFFRYAFMLLCAGQAAVYLAAGQIAGEMPSPGEVIQPNPAVVLGWLVILIVVFVVLLRLSLVFPAVAVDETYDLTYAWRHTKRQGLRLLGANFLASIPLFVVVWFILLALVPSPGVSAAQPATPDFGSVFVLHLVQNIVNYIVLGVTMAVIAAAFRTCAGWIPDTAGPPAPFGET